MATLRARFFCDDVRHELGNKLTLVGLYGESMMFPPGQGGLLLPKLAAVFVVGGLRNHAQVGVRQLISITVPGEGPKQLTGPVAPMARDPRQDEQNIVIQMSPVIFSVTPCRITASLEVTLGDDGPERFDYSIEVLRVSPGAMVPQAPAPTLPPGADMN